MIYEHRHYVAVPGKAPELHKRFEDSLLGLFEKHGMHVVGVWQPFVGSILNELHYILRWEDMKKMQDTWLAFYEDPEWLDVAAKTEAAGPLVEKAETQIWMTTPYSPEP
jgi:hypothetical protein